MAVSREVHKECVCVCGDGVEAMESTKTSSTSGNTCFVVHIVHYVRKSPACVVFFSYIRILKT